MVCGVWGPEILSLCERRVFISTLESMSASALGNIQQKHRWWYVECRSLPLPLSLSLVFHSICLTEFCTPHAEEWMRHDLWGQSIHSASIFTVENRINQWHQKDEFYFSYFSDFVLRTESLAIFIPFVSARIKMWTNAETNPTNSLAFYRRIWSLFSSK